jgi:hypothetical protein
MLRGDQPLGQSQAVQRRAFRQRRQRGRRGPRDLVQRLIVFAAVQHVGRPQASWLRDRSASWPPAFDLGDLLGRIVQLLMQRREDRTRVGQDCSTK